MTHPTFADVADVPALVREYPLDALALAAVSRDELRARQEARFASVMARAWQIPFYRRHWSAHGIEPGDIAGLDDLPRLPPYDKSDLMASAAAHPPLGDFAGLSDTADRPPVVFHTTSGTTGRPQPLLFGPKGREVGNILVARHARWLGVGSGDVVQSVYGHGTINGGHYIREAYTRFTNALYLSAGTGIETRSAAQVRLMADFGVTTLVGFVDYLRKLADVAREEGLLDRIGIHRIIGHLGAEDRAATEAAWGAVAYDWYGVGDTGQVAAEGPERDGLHVWEDAHWLELLDVETGVPVPDGDPGDMVVTCLYKDDVAPCIRFNTHDVSAVRPGLGVLGLRRIDGFLGRSDNMVKLRGVNVFPHAVAALIEGDPALTGEYVCRRTHADAMTVEIEHRSPSPAAAEALRTRLRAGLGVEVAVGLVLPGATALATGIDTRQKPIRLIDERIST